MKFKILVEGWTELCHSYAMVNYFQLKYLTQNPEIEVYLREVEFYSKDWKKHDKTLKVDVREYSGEKVDAVYRIQYPYNIKPHPEDPDTPVFLFYTSEFQNIDMTAFQIRSVDELLNRKYLHFITPSLQSANAFMGLNANITVIPHGIEKNTFYPIDDKEIEKNRAKFGLTKKDFVFLNVSAMTENKGIKLLLYTFYKLWKKYDHIYLVLKGNDIYKSNKLVDSYISELIFKNHIDIKDLPKLKKRINIIMEHLSFNLMNHVYNTADAYVSASCAEGFNIPVLEAFATGLPTLVPQYAPLTDVIPQKHHILSRMVKNNKGQVMIQISELDLYTKMESLIIEGRHKHEVSIPSEYVWEHVSHELVDHMKRYAIFYNKDNIRSMINNTFNKHNKNNWIDTLVKFMKNNDIKQVLDVGCLYYKIFDEIKFQNIDYEGVDVFEHDGSTNGVSIQKRDYKAPEKIFDNNKADLILFNRTSACLLNWCLRYTPSSEAKFILFISNEKPSIDPFFKYTVLEKFKDEVVYLFY